MAQLIEQQQSAIKQCVRKAQQACRASDKCQKEKRKTINGDDLLWAMGTLGFEDYVAPLNVYLGKFREVSLLPMNLREATSHRAWLPSLLDARMQLQALSCYAAALSWCQL